MLEKVTATDDALRIYTERDLSSAVAVQVRRGSEIQLGAATVFEGKEWIEATVENNVGYILAPNARSHTTLGALAEVDRPAIKHAVTCPRCGLLCPGNTRRCDCGYDFETSPERMRAEYTRSMREAVPLAIGGMVLAMLPIILIIIGFVTSPGSPRIFFYGLMIVGMGMAGRSITRIRNLRAARREYENASGH